MHKPRWWIAGVAAALVVSALGLYWFVFKPGQAPGSVQALPEIAIMEPVQGSLYAPGSQVPVEIRTFGEFEVAAIELWIDGQLLGSQAAEPGKSMPPWTSFLWLPSQPGTHSLVARSLGSDSPLAFSDAILIDISEDTTADGGADTVDYPLPSVLPTAGDLPAMIPPSFPGSVPVVEAWSGAPGPASSGDLGPKPHAPELIAEANGCGVQLLLHDQDEAEQGFRIYRQASNSQGWKEVAVLQPQDGMGWLAYNDTAYPGGFVYYASAFNQAGESPGNMSQVNIPQENCPSSPQAHPALALNLDQLLEGIDWDRAYCYRSADGTRWERFPLEGFFNPPTSPADTQAEMQFSLTNARGSGADSSLVLQLNCWGWNEGNLEFLGHFQHQFDLSSFDTLPAQIGKSEFQDSLLYLPAALTPQVHPFSGEVGFKFNPELPLPLPEFDGSMPYVHPYSSTDPEICTQHLPPEFQNLVGTLLFCSPYPGFNVGPGGENPQPHLVWDILSDCPQGSGAACTPYQSWLDKAEQEGGDIWFTVNDWSSEGYHTWAIDGAYMRNWTIKPLECAGTRDFQVRLFYSDADELIIGPASNLYTIECPRPIPWIIPLEITFDTIRFYSLDDGDSGEVVQDVEVFGYLVASTSQGNRFVNFAKWDQQADNCPDEAFSSTLNTGGTLFSGCTITFDDVAPYNLDEAQLCQSTSKYNCSLAGFGYENNTVQLGVDDGDMLVFNVLIIDWDDASGNDLQCLGWMFLPALDRLDWAKVQDQGFTIDTPNWGSGSCRIQGSVSAVLP